MAQLTVTACLIGLAVGQLVAGPLSDRFGRRMPLLIGVVAFIATSAWCAMAPSVEVLIVARFVQGLAGGVGIVIAQAAGRDIYSGSALIRYFGRITVLSGLAAIVGPLLGGALATVTDWRGLFMFLAGIGAVILLAVALRFTETLPAERRTRGGFAQTTRDYRALLGDRRFVGAVLGSGFAYAALFAYLAGATYVLQGIYGLTPQQYALAFGLNSAGFMVFGWLAARSSERWSLHGTLVAGLTMCGAGALGLLAAGLFAVPVAVVLVSLFLLVSGVAVTTPPTTTHRPGRPPADGGHGLFAARDVALRPRRRGRAARRHRGCRDHAAARRRRRGRARPGRGIRHPARYAARCRGGPDPDRARTRCRARAGGAPITPNRRSTHMRGVIMHGPGDVRVEDREKPTIIEPTDAIIRVTSACICGSDLWPYRGQDEFAWPAPMGHEYVGVVEEIGAHVRNVAVGDFVVGSFFASDNTCEICEAGYQSRCVHAIGMGELGTQAEYLRVPLADGTLVATPTRPTPAQERGLLAASDVLGTGWFAAVAAEAGPGKTVAVVGDGAVGLLGILAAKQLGAERVIAFSRHADRQALARKFGATDIVRERGDEGVAKVKELTGGLGAHSTIEAVGTQESMMQAIRATRAGGHVGYVGVAHGVSLDGLELFFSGVHLHGGPAPVRRFLPELIDLIMTDRITPGDVFDLTLPVEQAAEGYRAMDERRAIKVLLTF